MLLEVKNLKVEFDTLRGHLTAVDNLSFGLNAGETLGIVGESGCGKSLTSLSIMGLLPPTAKITASHIKFQGRNLLEMKESERCKLRGAKVAMIFQDPMTSLNPCFRVGEQIMEVLKIHQGGSKRSLRDQVINLFGEVGIPDAEMRFLSYPHQLSGGMCQRIMIAMSVACRPELLIADEPTTALDVTIQAQILALLKKLQRDYKMGLILITHDVGVVSEMSDRILVMYAGQAVEEGETQKVIEKPNHPYTFGLLQALPAAQIHEQPRTRLKSISGMVPDLLKRPSGCQMNPRCFNVQDRCRLELPEMTQVATHQGARSYRCFFPVQGHEKIT